MTISTTSNRMPPYSGNGSTTEFPFTFKVLAEADLEVVLVEDSTGTSVTQVLNTHYTIDGVGDQAGGTVTMVTAPASGYSLSIRRVVDVVQPTDFKNQGAFLPEVHEEAFDRLTMIDQQQQDQIDRSLRQPDDDSSDNYDAGGLRIEGLAEAVDAEDAVTLGQLEDAVAGITSTGSGVSPVEFSSTGDGVTTAFTLGSTNSWTMASDQFYEVYLDGLYQNSGNWAISAGGGNRLITFSVAPPNGVTVDVRLTGYAQQADAGADTLRADLASSADDADGDAMIAGKRTLANAVAFTLHQYHEQRALNLKTDCGATGDGTTDDTAAIQRASDMMAAGGAIFVPAGTYKHSADVDIYPFQKWYGEGKFVTTFAPTAAVTSGFVYLAPSLETGGIVIEDIGFDGNATTLRAIHLANLTLCVLRNIYTDGYSNVAAKPILWNNVESSLIDSPSLLNVTAGGGIYLTGDANNNTIISPTITAAAGGNGIVIDAGIYNTTIINPNLEGASLGDIGITCNGTINTRIETGFMEYWTGACVAANSGSAKNLAIRGVHLHATSAASQMVALNSAGTNDGVVVEDCYLALLGNGGTTTVGIDVGGSTRVRVRGNKSGGAGTGVVKVNGVVQTLPDYASPIGQPIQSKAYAATINTDYLAGEVVYVGALTNNVTIAAPTNGKIGGRLTYQFLQDGTGGRTVTWNAVFRRVSWSDTGNAANTRASITFVSEDGTNWDQVGAQKAWS